MLRYCLLLLPVIISACGSGSGSSTGARADSIAVESNEPPTGNFYKRYSGMLNGRGVVLQLHRRSGKVQGSFQFANEGRVNLLRNWADTTADEEYILSEILADGGREGGHWAISLRGRKATGQWRSPDGATVVPLSLTEEYPPGSTPLASFYLADSAALLPGKPSSPKAKAACSYLLPADGSKGFLYDALRSQVVPSSAPGDDPGTAISAENTAYFSAYRKDNASIVQGQDDADLALFALGYTRDQSQSVLYNDDYWLVIESFSSEYTGGAHGNYGSAFANIDLREQRIWQLADMVTDTNALRPMLNDAAAAYFRPKPGGEEQGLLVSVVPATSNVYLSATGLCFVYNPYEIASYAAGQIPLFLPYKKLMPFLTPAFKACMHLSERAGVAMLSVNP